MLPGESVNTKSPDFYTDLEGTIAYVIAQPDHDLADAQSRDEKESERLKGYSDYEVLWSESSPSPNTVFTTDPGEYAALLEQATEVLHGHVSPETPFDKTAYAEEDADIVAHELAHGSVMQQYGNEDTTVYYGVEFSRAPDGELEFLPHVTHSGPLRKIHEAWSALAPSHGRSDADLEVVQRLGYDPADREKIQALAEATPPVPPGWPPPQSLGEVGSFTSFAEMLQQSGFSNKEE
jgi:hypothetical protein